MNHDEYTMARLRVGDSGVVDSVLHAAAFQRRLTDLGLIPGTQVRCIGQAPSGSPMVFEIRGTKIALRKADASKIRLKNGAVWD